MTLYFMSTLYWQFKREKNNYKNSSVFQDGASILYSVLWEHKGEEKNWGQDFAKGMSLILCSAADESEKEHYRFT